MDFKYYMFDWDDNVLHMPTKIYLEKKSPAGWQPYPVTTAEFARIRSDSENYRAPDGDWDNAFVDFDDIGDKGDEQFLDDTREALGPVIEGREQGAPSFQKFRKAVVEGRVFAIITARAHSSNAIRKGVEYFLEHVLSPEEKQEMIGNLKHYVAVFESDQADLPDHELISRYLNLNKYRGVTSPEFQDLMGLKVTGAERPEEAKQLAIKEFVLHVIELMKGRADDSSISVGFSDDDPGNVEAAERFLREELSLQFPDVKFVVYDTSDPDMEHGRKIVLEKHKDD